MLHFYFFKSTCKNDVVNNLNIFARSSKIAFILANRYFDKHNCKGKPELLEI